jgi:hypothetical protein
MTEEGERTLKYTGFKLCEFKVNSLFGQTELEWNWNTTFCNVRCSANDLVDRVCECVFSFVFVRIALIVVNVVFVLNSLSFFFFCLNVTFLNVIMFSY